jgi:hypothetical protein
MTYRPTARVLLTTLSVRTSSKGNEYLTGYLGKAKVVGFRGEPDKWGQDTWDLWLATPEPRTDAPAADVPSKHPPALERAGEPPAARSRPVRREGGGSRQERAANAALERAGSPTLNDDLPF